MKSSHRKMRMHPEVPYEKEGIETWLSITRNYTSAMLLAVPVDQRVKWMKHPCCRDLNVFSCGYYVVAHGLDWSRSGLNEGVVIYCVDGKGTFSARRKT